MLCLATRCSAWGWSSSTVQPTHLHHGRRYDATTTTLSGELVLGLIDGSLLTGIYTETLQIDLWPTETNGDQARRRPMPRPASLGTNTTSISTAWATGCACSASTTSSTANDEFNNIVFERVPEGHRD